MASYCPNCSGNLLFSPSRQAMYCRMCGGTFKPEDVGESDRASVTYDCNIYSCPSCGGTIAVTGTEVSTSCVYCGNATVIFDRVSKQQRPEGIIPFKLTREKAVEIVRKQMKGSPFIPEEIRNVKEEDIKGIYIPYWLASAKSYDCMILRSQVKHGKNSSTYYYGRAAFIDAINMPVEAVSSINDKFSKRIEPFDLNDLVDFDEDYLMGFYSNTPDLTREELQQTVDNKIHKKLADYFCQTLPGTRPDVSQAMHWTKMCDNEIMMFCPCWFYTFVYKKKTYTFMVNGQNGKVAGTLPWNKGPIVKKGLLLASIITLLLFVPLCFLSLETLLQLFLTLMLFTAMISVPFILSSAMAMKEIKSNLNITQSGSVFNFVNKRRG